MTSIIPDKNELTRIHKEKGSLGIDDLLGNGFTESLQSAIKEARLEKALEAQVDYEFFRDTILPYLAGEEKDPELLRKWVAFLGGLNVSANVVRDGELYVVIPPITKPMEFALNPERIPPAAAFDEYSKLAVVNEGKAARQLLGHIKEWYKGHSLEDMYQELKKWNTIYKEHGYPEKDLSSLELLLFGEGKAGESATEPAEIDDPYANEEW